MIEKMPEVMPSVTLMIRVSAFSSISLSRRSGGQERTRPIRSDQLVQPGSLDPKIPAGGKEIGTGDTRLFSQSTDHSLPRDRLVPGLVLCRNDVGTVHHGQTTKTVSKVQRFT